MGNFVQDRTQFQDNSLAVFLDLSLGQIDGILERLVLTDEVDFPLVMTVVTVVIERLVWNERLAAAKFVDPHATVRPIAHHDEVHGLTAFSHTPRCAEWDDTDMIISHGVPDCHPRSIGSLVGL